MTQFAFAKEQMTKEEAIEEICGATANYAKSVMSSRQNGVSITESISNLNKTLPPGSQRDFHKAIAMEAYKETKWVTEENKMNAISEFSNKIYLTCSDSFLNELRNVK